MKAKASREQLLEDVEVFLAKTGMYASYLGRDAVNDTALVSRLRAGRDVRSETADRVRAFMRTWKKPKAAKRKMARA